MTHVEKHVVRISREWHNPQISIDVTAQEIAIEMPLIDFIKAMVAEAGNPAALLTRSQLERALQDAARRVCASMKKETVSVM